MDKKIMVSVQNVTVRLNKGNQRVNNLKEYVIKTIKKELNFQELLAVKDVSLEVREGEAWALIGTNGSGKSTLLKTICGIMTPYRGRIKVNGSVSPLIELGAGFDGELTAKENIFLNGALLGYDEEFMKSHYDGIVEFADLSEFMDMPIKNYSSGMRARLGFSIATMVKPDILIVDEVLAVGDAVFQQKCIKRMNEMLEGGTTLLFVSHSMATVRRLCTNALWLDHGEGKMQGPADEVCDAYEAFLKVPNTRLKS